MSTLALDKIEYIILLVAEFAIRNNVPEQEAYTYLNHYGALSLCDRHYNIMHTLSVEENVDTLKSYCRKKGGML